MLESVSKRVSNHPINQHGVPNNLLDVPFFYAQASLAPTPTRFQCAPI